MLYTSDQKKQNHVDVHHKKNKNKIANFGQSLEQKVTTFIKRSWENS